MLKIGKKFVFEFKITFVLRLLNPFNHEEAIFYILYCKRFISAHHD